jgi:hypothetical protein
MSAGSVAEWSELVSFDAVFHFAYRANGQTDMTRYKTLAKRPVSDRGSRYNIAAYSELAKAFQKGQPDGSGLYGQ